MGQTEEAAREAAQAGGFTDKIAIAKTSFKANSKVSLEQAYSGNVLPTGRRDGNSTPF